MPVPQVGALLPAEVFPFSSPSCSSTRTARIHHDFWAPGDEIALVPHRGGKCSLNKAGCGGGLSSFTAFLASPPCTKTAGDPIITNTHDIGVQQRRTTTSSFSEGEHGHGSEHEQEEEDHAGHSADGAADVHGKDTTAEHALEVAWGSFGTCLMAFMASSAAFLSGYINYQVEKEEYEHEEAAYRAAQQVR
mmetsp:Transcript_88687/g.185385  ORF Transcript_88687/g.185385 Transcript_88687/m.185385 type:complete len:191 (-) Transcript_88687:141-713(-)